MTSLDLHSKTEEIELQLLLEAAYRAYGYDLRDYSRASLIRRLAAVKKKHSFANLSEVQSRILHDSGFFAQFLSEITVPVTEMFRDPVFYQMLVKEVFPYLATYPEIRVWIAGCATGEEAYSMLALLADHQVLDRTILYATDINPAALARARTGFLSENEVREATSRYAEAGGRRSFHHYCTLNYDSGLMAQSLMDHAVFSDHNLVTDGVFGEMNLILCRNVLIYFNRALRSKVLELFSNSLAPGGYFAVGFRERVESGEAGLSEFNYAGRIYRRDLA